MGKLPNEIEPGLPLDFLITTKSNMVLTLKSTIYERLNDEQFKALMPIYNGKLLPLERDLKLYVVYNVKEIGRFEFEAIITGRSVDENIHVLTMTALTEVKKSQRRNFYRVPFFESVQLVRLDRPLAEEEQKKLMDAYEKAISKYKDRKDIIVDDPPLLYEAAQIECRDISGGGIRCLSRYELKVFEPVEGIVHVDGLYVPFKGEVIRVSPSFDSVYPFELGIKFTEMDETIRTKLISYVFKKQRNLMKKG